MKGGNSLARWPYFAGVGLAVLGALGVQIMRPVGPATFRSTIQTPQLKGPWNLKWPQDPESYLAVIPGGAVGSHGPSRPVPVGSVTKMMTAYLLLKKYPLGRYAQGPDMTITAQDVQQYHQDILTQQSVAKVVAGETLSERKILEGLLVASGNNIAHLAAAWVSGSSPAFTRLMNQEAQKLGLHHTHFVGPSGLNAGNVSTPRDETLLAERMMQIPVFQQIVGMAQITWPHSRKTIENFNYAVGHDGITGVKTGSTVIAGGSFVFSAAKTIGTQHVTIYGAVLGQRGTVRQPSQLQLALQDGESLINQVAAKLEAVSLVRKGQVVGTLEAPWTHPVSVVATRTLSSVLWPGEDVHESVHWKGTTANPSAPWLSIHAGSQHWSIPLKPLSSVPRPTMIYRLTRGM